jgi:hypothetical protein
VGRFRSVEGQAVVAEQADLLQHRGLIPVDILVRRLAVAKADDGNQRNFDVAARRFYVRRIRGISMVWVKEITTSSTRLVSPMVGETSVILKSGGMHGMKSVP